MTRRQLGPEHPEMGPLLALLSSGRARTVPALYPANQWDRLHVPPRDMLRP